MKTYEYLIREGAIVRLIVGANSIQQDQIHFDSSDLERSNEWLPEPEVISNRTMEGAIHENS